MKGARPLDNSEILLVSEQFTGTYAIRNRSLFMLGVSVGGRISELLALCIGDVWQNHQPVKDLLFQKDIVKGKENARKYLGVSYQKAQRVVESIATGNRNRTCLSLHSPDDIPDDTILIQAIKRGLINPQAIMTQPDERKRATGKVIPIERARRRHTAAF